MITLYNLINTIGIALRSNNNLDPTKINFSFKLNNSVYPITDIKIQNTNSTDSIFMNTGIYLISDMNKYTITHANISQVLLSKYNSLFGDTDIYFVLSEIDGSTSIICLSYMKEPISFGLYSKDGTTQGMLCVNKFGGMKKDVRENRTYPPYYEALKNDKKTLKVKACWEFEVDISDFDPKHVNISELAVDLTKRELDSLLDDNELSSEDFNYLIEME